MYFPLIGLAYLQIALNLTSDHKKMYKGGKIVNKIILAPTLHSDYWHHISDFTDTLREISFGTLVK